LSEISKFFIELRAHIWSG